MRFGESLERYFWKKMGVIPWRRVGVSIVVVGVGVSLVDLKQRKEIIRLGLFPHKEEVVVRAVEKLIQEGDYANAKKVLERVRLAPDQRRKLKEEIEVKERIEKEVLKYEELLRKYPYHQDILKNLAKLYRALGNEEGAKRYQEKLKWVGVR